MLPTPAGSFRLFRLFGVTVYLHWSWFVIAAIQFQLAQGNRGLFHNPTWHLGLYITLFAIVTMHEFGHALACRSVGGQADRIILWPLGGVAFVRPPQRPGAVLWSLAAGPLVNVILVPVTVGATIAALWSASADHLTDFQTYVMVVAWINGVLLAFNMLPIYPLDGGQIVQAILWFFVGRVRSLQIVAPTGIVIAVIGGLAALFLIQDWYMGVMALFIGWQAFNGYRLARYLAAAEKAGYQVEEPRQ